MIEVGGFMLSLVNAILKSTTQTFIALISFHGSGLSRPCNTLA